MKPRKEVDKKLLKKEIANVKEKWQQTPGDFAKAQLLYQNENLWNQIKEDMKTYHSTENFNYFEKATDLMDKNKSDQDIMKKWKECWETHLEPESNEGLFLKENADSQKINLSHEAQEKLNDINDQIKKSSLNREDLRKALMYSLNNAEGGGRSIAQMVVKPNDEYPLLKEIAEPKKVSSFKRNPAEKIMRMKSQLQTGMQRTVSFLKRVPKKIKSSIRKKELNAESTNKENSQPRYKK